jgi:hypothetical protein
MGRQKKDGNCSPAQNNLIQDSEGNEENGYPVPDSNKRKINDAKETNNANKNTLKLWPCEKWSAFHLPWVL